MLVSTDVDFLAGILTWCAQLTSATCESARLTALSGVSIGFSNSWSGLVQVLRRGSECNWCDVSLSKRPPASTPDSSGRPYLEPVSHQARAPAADRPLTPLVQRVAKQICASREDIWVWRAFSCRSTRANCRRRWIDWPGHGRPLAEASYRFIYNAEPISPLKIRPDGGKT